MKTNVVPINGSPIEASIECFTGETIPHVWKDVQHFIERSVQGRNGWQLVDILERLVSGEAVLLVARVQGEIRGAAVVKKVEYPSKVALFVLALGGIQMPDWSDAMETALKTLAAGKPIMASVRPGLAKLLRKRGWKRISENFELEGY